VAVNAQWQPRNDGIFGANVNALATNGTKLYAGTGAGVFNGGYGTGWSRMRPDSQVYAPVRSLLVDGPTDMYAGCESGKIYVSTDDGYTWIQKSIIGTNIIINTLVATNNMIIAGNADGCFISTDKGDSWIQRNNGLTNTRVLTLVAGNSIYAGTFGGGIFSSIDSG